MKPWIKLAIVVVLASSTAVWADVDFKTFGFLSAMPSRKQPKRSYVAELNKNLSSAPPASMVASRSVPQRVRLAQAQQQNYSDADQPITIREPIVLPPEPVRPAPIPWNRVVVDSMVVENEWYGIKISACDRAVEDKFSDNLPTIVECQVRNSRTVYYTNTARRDQDYNKRRNIWSER